MNIYTTASEQKILEIIEQDLSYLGYEIVRIKIRGGAKQKTLQIMIDRKDGTPINIEDCEKASRQVSALMDVEDPIENAYVLEMSSAGLNRPITRYKDLELAKGQKVKLQSKLAINGSRNFSGQLISYDETCITLSIDNNNIQIPLANIHEANIVFQSPTTNKKGRK